MDFPATPSNASDSNDYSGLPPLQIDTSQDNNKRRRYKKYLFIFYSALNRIIILNVVCEFTVPQDP